MAKRQLYLGRPRLSWHCKQFQMQRNLELVGRGGFEPPTNGLKVQYQESRILLVR